MTLPITVCGRTFTEEDLALIRDIIGMDNINRTQISREVCRRLSWLKLDGGLKDMSCRVALLRLHRSGLIELPLPRGRNGKGGCRINCTTEGNVGNPLRGDLATLGTVKLIRITNRPQSHLWNELIQRYHYLGYTPLPGAQVRYLIYSGSGALLGAIGFSAAAWALCPRDEFIGWSREQRMNRLRLVANNSRFLILPWVQVKNLASKVLALCAKQLPTDWEGTYGYAPVMLETFVEKARFKGTCYKAANWYHVGQTRGRGKLDRKNEYSLPVKDIYLYPLRRDFRDIITQPD